MLLGHLEKIPGAGQEADPGVLPAVQGFHIQVQYLAPMVQAIPLQLALQAAEFC